MKAILAIGFLTLLFSEFAGATTYYVDFDSGGDNRSGLSPGQSWKHAPGDSQAIGQPAAATLQPGDTVLLKGGVTYKGSISVNASGVSGQPITYKGDGWGTGKAVIEGGEILTGWTPCPSAAACGNNSHWANLYVTEVSSTADVLGSHLLENGEFLSLAEDPSVPNAYSYDDQSFFYAVPPINQTTTSLVDPLRFNQPDPHYWDGAFLLLYTLPAAVVLRPIDSYIPPENKVTFPEIRDPTGYNKYAIFNALPALDVPGEYYFETKPQPSGGCRLILWPRDTADLVNKILMPLRTFGLDMGANSHLVVEGFVVRHCGGTSLRDGIGIGSHTWDYLPKSDWVIRQNDVQFNMNTIGGGFGTVYLSNLTTGLIEGNTLEGSLALRGIIATGCAGLRIKGNTIQREDGTSIYLAETSDSIIDDNSVLGGGTNHANGITIYQNSHRILVWGNRVLNNPSPMTIQASSDLTIANNVIDVGGNSFGLASWGGMAGTVQIFNNLVVNSGNHFALALSADAHFVVRNNIVDGAGCEEPTCERSHNLYVGLLWNQDPASGWSPAEGELLLTEGTHYYPIPSTQVFVNFEGGDFHLKSVSPAIDAGVDVSSLWPRTTFPDFDFSRDITGGVRPAGAAWDMGPYEFSASVDTPPPSAHPTVGLTANPASIRAWGTSQLTWVSSSAVSCVGTGFTTGGVSQGGVTLRPLKTTTYQIVCTGTGGSATAEAVVEVKGRMSLAPNPAQGNTTVRVMTNNNGEGPAELWVRIFNLKGEKVLEEVKNTSALGEEGEKYYEDSFRTDGMPAGSFVVETEIILNGQSERDQEKLAVVK